MDTRPRRIELRTDKGIVFGYVLSNRPLKVVPDLGDDGGINAVAVSRQADILDEQPLDRGVAGPLTKAEQASIDCRATIEPRPRRVDEDLMKVIMAVPFDLFGGDPRIIDEGADELRHTPRQGSARIGDA